MMRPAELYACLYARELPMQAILRLKPELRERPCVVMQGEPPLQHVWSLNTKARLLGMAHGMTRVEIETFPEAVVLSRSASTEAAAKAVLLECAGGFSPRIEDRSEPNAFLCTIDIAGTQGLFGPPEMLARSLLERVRSLGISACVTISSNPHAAICLAKGLSHGRTVQQIASGDEAAALAALPLSVLDLTEAQAETFELWGIRTFGMLADLPEQELIARMGQEGRRLRQLARGELPHLFQPVEPAFVLEERIELEAPVELLDSLLFVLSVMIDQLIVRAKARIVALASITVTLTLEGGGLHTRSVWPALASTDKQLWIKLLHLDLEAHPPQAPILGVTLQAEPGTASKVQLGLFSPQLPESAKLDVTLARIRAIVGEQNAGRAVLEDTHASEAFRMEPFTVPAGQGDVRAASPPRAAMRQLRPLEEIAVTLKSLRPVAFHFRAQRYAVEQAYGPWRADGNWWNQTLWGHEQWDLVARAENGQMICCCVTRDLMQNQWQMAALYD